MDTALPPSASSSAIPTMDTPARPFRVGVIYHGDMERRRSATPETSKVPAVFAALAMEGIEGVPVVYHDDFRDAVCAQLLQLDGALAWVNPIEDGHDRTQLDALLREVEAAGVFVSTHPDIILKLGTKQVLIDTQSMSWSAPGTQVHRTPDELRAVLTAHVAAGAMRVLKQYRGHSGQGIWKVEPDGTNLRVREAPRGSPEQVMSVDAFVARCGEYFNGDGRMVDQLLQARLPEGMIRCYLVHDQVEGFGHQAVNALCPALSGTPRDAFPATTKRLYHPPDQPEFQALKRQLEGEWLPQLQELFTLSAAELPVLWDCDFMLGPKTANGADTYVLCEINVSSVSPFPDSALAPLARTVRARVLEARATRARRLKADKTHG